MLQIKGEIYQDELHQMLYATDASVYRQRPTMVALPKDVDDLKAIIKYARANKLTLIPRAAGTSLAGQVVGEGIVVDISKYFKKIIELNVEERWVRVEPGVIRDELNAYLAPFGLFFGPNTSTANRCMIGGMVGNNSCGTTSIVYGSTRDRTLALKVLLDDGSEAEFMTLSQTEVAAKKQLNNREGELYRHIESLLAAPERREQIAANFPKPSIHRRNTGYAIDLLAKTNLFESAGADFNFCSLLCGSEGTLAFTTEIKLALDPLPAPEVAVVAAHFASINESMEAVLTAMAEEPSACELMDKTILDLTKGNIEQDKNRFFVEGDPAAILLVECRGNSKEELEQKTRSLIAKFQEKQQGFAYPIIEGVDTNRVWKLRAAGLGILANLAGDAKAVACIEDTAVDLVDLPAFIAEFGEMMDEFGQQAVYYAHAGAGEIHLRPILNLKKTRDRQLFYDITLATAKLVKKYGGSLSGEHGDGRVRAPFIPLMIGEDNYQLLKEIKKAWDPNGIFNPGKITDTPAMNEDFRYEAEQEIKTFPTAFDYSEVGSMLQLAEKCNGSGDCRKLAFSGGTMCPSYRATLDEKDSTRGRANVLREVLTQNAKESAFQHPALEKALSLCLSCKGCTAECPSNVDMAGLKAEYLHQKYQISGVPFRAKIFGSFSRLMAIGAYWPGLTNFLLASPISAPIIKSLLGVASKRSLPPVAKRSFRNWWRKNGNNTSEKSNNRRKVWLFCDEFTNYNDPQVGIAAFQLLQALGYEVELAPIEDSARAQISKGLLSKAKIIAQRNLEWLDANFSEQDVLIGLEPSALLGFRDEYPRLLRGEQQQRAKILAKQCLLLEEFLASEIREGNIKRVQFDQDNREIYLHGHCHHKALSKIEDAAFVLSFPAGHNVQLIPSGCCGMAGSFGYEKEHYDLSMKIGEETLFPALRQMDRGGIVVASGTSCRHQIFDGVKLEALHPAQVLLTALSET